jgi:hypothetical protein
MLLNLWDLVTYEKLGKIENGIIIQIHLQKDVNETTYSLIQEGGLTDLNEHPDSFSKVISAEKVPLEYYTNHRSWRVRAYGYEQLSLKKNIPRLLDLVYFKETYEVGNHSMKLFTCVGAVTSWTIVPKFEINVKIINVAFPELPGGARFTAIQGFSEIVEEYLGTDESIDPKRITKIERVSFEEALTSEYEDLRDLANDLMRERTPRPYLGDLSFINFPSQANICQ